MIGTEAIAEFLINSEETKVVSTVLCCKNSVFSVELLRLEVRLVII